MTTESNQASYRQAIQRLSAAQKPGPGVPAYTRWVNRRAGRVLAAAAFARGISPNAVTLLSGLVSLVGIVILAAGPNTWPVAAAVAVLLLLGYALDSADGQVARLTGQSSKAGEWLDHVVDAARLPAFHMAIAASLWRALDPGQQWLATLGLFFALLVSVWFFAQILAGQLGDGGDVAPARSTPNWVSFAKLPSDIGTLYLMVLLLPLPQVFTAGYSLLFAYSVVMAGVSFARRYRQLQGLSRHDAA